MTIPCMKLTSATAGVRRGMTAVSGERILLLCPGAPGCTIGALPVAGVSGWPHAVTSLTKSTTTEVSTCRRPVIIIGSRNERNLGNVGESESLPSTQHVPEDTIKRQIQ